MELWHNNPQTRMLAAKQLSKTEQDILIDQLCRTYPLQQSWPYGMPTSINPIVVIVGVSPGNSPDPNDREICEAIKNKQLSAIKYAKPSIGVPHEGIFYKDTKKYWDKTRELCISVVKRYAPTLSETDCLSLSGHLNLGLGAFGTAKSGSVEVPIIQWVSELLLSHLRPRVVVLFGLKTILLKNKEYQEAWNHKHGLQINWAKSSREIHLNGRTKEKFSIWDSFRDDNETVKVVMWPNHPSRCPFTNRIEWTKSVEQFTTLL